MDGKKTRKREEFRSRRPSSERERERERGAALFGLLENAAWQNANYLALFPACKDACKKRGQRRPLVPYSYVFPSSLRLPLPPRERCSLTRRLQFLSLLASSIPLFLFLFKQAAFNSRIFVHFRGLSSLRPNFGFVWKFTEGAALNVFLNKQQDFQDNSGIRFENRDRRSNTSVLVDRFFEFSSVRQTKSSKRSELIKFRATRNVIETLGRFCMQSCGHKFPVFDRFHDEECNDVFEGGERNRSHVSPSLSSNYPVPSVPRMHGIWLNSVVSRLLSTTFSFTRASEIRRSLPLCWLTANDCIIDRPLLFDRRPRYNLCVLQSSKISNKLI